LNTVISSPILPRLRETLNTLMTRYHNLDSKFRGTNRDLTEEYERLTRQFQDLQGKFKHFEEADEKKFSEVWGMHEQECRDFAQKVRRIL
jgi:dynein regulatry complex protein 1